MGIIITTCIIAIVWMAWSVFRHEQDYLNARSCDDAKLHIEFLRKRSEPEARQRVARFDRDCSPTPATAAPRGGK